MNPMNALSNARARRISMVLGALLMVGATGSGCADGPVGPAQGQISLGLSALDGASWIRVRLFDGVVSSDVDGTLLFDTGCLQILSETYDLQNIDAGDDRTVVIEGFSASGCRPERRTAIGMRGDITVSVNGKSPHYHITVLTEPGLTPLPEGLNISENSAVKVDLCQSDSDCTGVVSLSPYCHKGTTGGTAAYWCVPSCKSDAQCRGLQEDAVCGDGGWCMLYHPFPLNLSEPRAFGHAFPMPDGGVALIGGFSTILGNQLGPASRFGERFDPETGLFTELALNGSAPIPLGLSGAGQFADGRVLIAGGFRALDLTIQGLGSETRIVASGMQPGHLSTDVLVWNPRRSRIVPGTLPVALAGPAVTPISSGAALVIGGLKFDGNVTVRSTDIFRCSVDGDDRPSCTKFGTLAAGRAFAAATCVDAACAQVLVVGGQGNGAPAELITVESTGATSAPLVNAQTPTQIGNPALCGSRLVGGSNRFWGVGGLPVAAALSASAPSLGWTPLANPLQEGLPIYPAVAETSEGDCWVAGGLSSGGAVSSRAFRVTGNALIPNFTRQDGSLEDYQLNSPRFGAAAAEIRGGALNGSILIGGGLSRDASGRLTFVRGAEILRP